MLSNKAKEPDKPSTAAFTSNYTDGKQQSYLKKAEPPRWLGDPLEFADFWQPPHWHDLFQNH